MQFIHPPALQGIMGRTESAFSNHKVDSPATRPPPLDGELRTRDQLLSHCSDHWGDFKGFPSCEPGTVNED